MLTQKFRLPIALFPTAVHDRFTEGMIADIFQLHIGEVRAHLSFTRDLLISRAIEAGHVRPGWSPLSYHYFAMLDELSRAISGHWSKLLTEVEREERRHVQFVLRIMRRQYQESIRHVL